MESEINEKKCYNSCGCCRGKTTHWILTILFCIIFTFSGFFAGKLSDCDESKRCNSHYYSKENQMEKFKNKCCSDKNRIQKVIKKKQIIGNEEKK
jgi:hypothetical protein